MSFILPVALSMLLGATFDLQGYNFLLGKVYDLHTISPLTQITEINTITAEYRLIESQVELRKFFGIDVASSLKALVNEYYYNYRRELQHEISASTADKLHLALKINLRLVNETVPYGTPEVSDWESDIGWRIGTHYVKSIIYGSDVFLILSISTRNRQHKTALKEALLTAVGRSGTLDESFKEKFNAFVQENKVGYFYNFFGSVPFYADNVPAVNVDDMLALKRNLVSITKPANDGKGIPIFYEMQPLSQLSPRVPLLEINGDILKTLEDVEWKFEDLRFAYKQFLTWAGNSKDLSEDDEIMIVEFYEELSDAFNEMTFAILDMDISTAGSIDQFSTALESYGNTNDTHKYRNKAELLRLQFSDTIDNY